MYQPDLDTIMAALKTDDQLANILALPAFADFNADDVAAILGEAAKLAAQVLSPLNRPGDLAGAKRQLDGSVVSPDGFKAAYQAYVAGGWQGVCVPAEFGGMGLPRLVGLAVFEMVHAANMSFGLCPMLTLSAIEALMAHGTKEQQDAYLPFLVTGQYSGTMCLTEPNAGSDVGALSTKAKPLEDGTYRLFGTKIYITWGQHDLAENIIHLVLARLPDAPEGSRGISLFLVPKILPDGALNDVTCLGLEHKMGIHASPTCTMGFGVNGSGAIGYMVGQPHRGLAAMFTMMNAARLNVGLEGVAIGEAALQKARQYSGDRVQSPVENMAADTPISGHPDVRRMLAKMEAKVKAARAICYATAAAADMAENSADAELAAKYKAREALLTPISKAWGTDVGIEAASLGVQIHGGMGFVEEGGAAQYYRDGRIAAIYEGTNGIQANDLIGRKLSGDNGFAFFALCDDLRAGLSGTIAPELADSAAVLSSSIDAMADTARFILENGAKKRENLARAYPFLTLCGNVIGGAFLFGLAQNGRNRDKALWHFYAGSELSIMVAMANAIKADQHALDEIFAA